MKANVIFELAIKHRHLLSTKLLWQNPSIPITKENPSSPALFLQKKVGNLVYFIGSVNVPQIWYAQKGPVERGNVRLYLQGFNTSTDWWKVSSTFADTTRRLTTEKVVKDCVIFSNMLAEYYQPVEIPHFFKFENKKEYIVI